MSLTLGEREQVELVGEPVRMKDDDQPDDDHQQLQAELGQRQHDQPDLTVATGDVGDVEDRRQADHHDRHRQLHVAAAEAARDRRQVVRDGDRGRGDHDQVVDQDRPAGDEADQLVEGVAREGRRPAPLAEHRAALDVRQRGEREHQPRRQEDQGRQPQASIGDHADREVDREADRSRSGRVEERARRAGAWPSSGRSPHPRIDRYSLPGAERDEEQAEQHTDGERPPAARQRQHQHQRARTR